MIVGQATKDPRVTTEQLKASLALATVNVHESIRRTMNNNGVQGRVARRKPLLPKNNFLLVCSLLKVMWTNQKAVGREFE